MDVPVTQEDRRPGGQARRLLAALPLLGLALTAPALAHADAAASAPGTAGDVVLSPFIAAEGQTPGCGIEVAGFGMSADAYHMTAPSEDGEGAARCMINALKNSKIDLSEVDYVNAHGTSTPLGDIAETIAVKRCFGEHAKKLAVNSTKSMTGHLLGAAGGIEAIFSALAIYHQISPPTINLENQDPKCDLDYVPNEARRMNINVALSNSFGFGGTNGTLVFRKM